MTRSTSRCARMSSAAAPCSASSTSHVSSRIARMEARTPSSSSTTSTVPRRRVVSGGPLSRSFIGFAVGAAAQSSAARRSGREPAWSLALAVGAAAQSSAARRSGREPAWSLALAVGAAAQSSAARRSGREPAWSLALAVGAAAQSSAARRSGREPAWSLALAVGAAAQSSAARRSGREPAWSLALAVGAAAQSSAARRSGTQYVASFRRPPIEDDVLVAGVGAGAMEVEQRGLAGRDRGQCLAERLCVADGLTPDLEDHVAAPKTGAGGRTACGDVDDEDTLRDGEVEPVGDAGRERLDVQPEAVLARLGPHGRLLRRHLADRHRGRLARTVAHDDDAHALARGEPGDAPLQVGHLADAHTVDLDDDVAGP